MKLPLIKHDLEMTIFLHELIFLNVFASAEPASQFSLPYVPILTILGRANS